jgi:hypothetical protein
MAVTNTDLLLVQRGNTPRHATAEMVSNYVRNNVDATDIGIASASQLGVIRVGQNLAIDANGILEAVLPAGLEYRGVLTDPTAVPSPLQNGYFWVWDGGDGQILQNAGWGSANGETVNDGDRIIYDGSQFDIVPGGGGGISGITGTAPIQIDDTTDPAHPDVSITQASASDDGYITSADWSKLDGIEAGAEANVDPTSTFAATGTAGTLTLQPGGDTTAIPAATDTVAGLMSANDKATLDNLVASPGGVLSIVAGDNITVNTTSAPGTAGTPEVSVTANSFIPFDLNDLQLLT